MFDHTGNFWFSDLAGQAVYYAKSDGSFVDRAWTGISSPNGVGLSPDGTALYASQTFTRQVLRRRIVSAGRLEPSPNHDIRALLRTGAANADVLLVGLPGGQELDSLAVEADGSVCVATLMESGITVVSPEGVVREKHTLPPALGGDDMRTAFITLSKTGRLIACRWPRPGLRLNFQQ